MENFDFIAKTTKRIHDVYVGKCSVCPLHTYNCTLYLSLLEEEIKPHFLNFLKEWDQKHPIVTNRDKFKEVFGDIPKGFMFSPKWLDAEYIYRYDEKE